MRRRQSHGSKRGRRDFESYASWPHVCANHPNFLKLSPHAKALLFFFLGQYRGKNNGDLSCAWGKVQDANLGTRNTVEKARAELEETGWIVRTRQGSVNRCCLYALTFRAIDDCDNKLDEPSGLPLAFWKDGTNPWLDRQRATRPRRTGIPRGSKIIPKRRKCATVAQGMSNPCSRGEHQSRTYPMSCASAGKNEPAPSPPDAHLSTSTMRSAVERLVVTGDAAAVEARRCPSLPRCKNKSVLHGFPVPPSEGA